MAKIFDKLKNKLGFKEPLPIEKTKSSDGQKLTEWEKEFIWKQIQMDMKVPCINCESANMYEGASGGASVNIRCPKCGQGINFILLPNSKGKETLDWCDNIGIDKDWIVDENK